MTIVRRWLPLVWLTAIAVVVGVMLIIPPARAQLALSFTRQPTPFTELYFVTGEELAERVDGGLVVRFVVHSHNTTRSTYTVRVGVQDGDGSRQAEQKATLEPGEQRSMNLTVPRVSGRWSAIDVDLVESADRLHWMRTPGEQKALR